MRAAAMAGAAAVLTVIGCAGGDGAEGADRGARPELAALDTLATPAGPFSGEPNLVTGADGVYLSWLERSDAGHALRFARWEGEGWSEPGMVMDRDDLFVNWADFPAMTVLDDGTLAAHWLEKSGPGTYSYDVRMALSSDRGRSWSEDVIPHRDGIEAEHGFVALFPVDGEVGVTWLDGRETVAGKPMTLRFTTVAPDGELGPGVLLDASTCDCCQTGMAMTSDGPIVAYRDRTADEVRDIAVVRRVNGEWTEPQIVHDDGWVIPGCPVNGPSIAAEDHRVAVAWFTGAPLSADAERNAIREAGERGRVLAAFSDDGGASFGEPVRVDDGEAMGRVHLALLDDGSALVTWLERVEGAAEVRVRHVDPTGVGSATSITGTDAQRASGFPRMARSEDRIFFAWTEPGERPRVRTAVSSLGERTGGAQ